MAQDDCERPAARAPEKGGPGRLMGFKRSRFEFEQPDLREPDAPDPDATADYSLNYEQELADFEALPEQEPEEPEEPAPANLDPSDLFAYSFRVHLPMTIAASFHWTLRMFDVSDAFPVLMQWMPMSTSDLPVKDCRGRPRDPSSRRPRESSVSE